MLKNAWKQGWNIFLLSLEKKKVAEPMSGQPKLDSIIETGDKLKFNFSEIGRF